jgi:hypothetical protein
MAEPLGNAPEILEAPPLNVQPSPLPNAQALQPVPPPPPHAGDGQPGVRAASAPVRARAPSKCSVCFANGITDHSHTKPTCPNNANARHPALPDGSSIPGAISSRALPSHHVAVRPHSAAPVLPVAPANDGDDSSSESSSEGFEEEDEVGSGDDGSSDTSDDEAPALHQNSFHDAAWDRYILLPQQPSVVPPASHHLRSAVFIGPLRPPPIAMFGPEVPPFIHSNEKGGPRNIPASCKTTWDFIDLLFVEEDWLQLCTYTNLAATTMPRHQGKTRLKRWKPVAVVEMKMFFAISSYLGVVGIQNRKASWSRSGLFGQNFLHGCMSLRRFEAIVSCLHYEDSWTMTPEDLKRANVRDSFWQVHGLVDHVTRQAKIYWKMGRKISVDEAVIPFKGRHRGRCYNPSKPAKYHFKTFAMNDAETGYQYHSYYYRGKDETRPDEVPATMWPVVTMVVQSPEIQNAGHVLTTDNWYTQPRLTEWLAEKGIQSIGTCKTSRLNVVTPTRPIGFPRAGVFKAKFGGKRERGTSLVHETTVAGRKYYLTSWQDKKGVYILSSYAPSQGTCFRKIKVGRTWTEQKLPRPSVVRHYNAGMGGTDLHDQRLSAFRSTLKSRRWQVRTLTNTFQSVCMNAYILQKMNEGKGSKYSSLDFIEAMISECAMMQLTPEQLDSRASPFSPRAFDRHKREYWETNPLGRTSGRHFLHQLEGQVLPDVEGDKRKNNRRQCMVCAARCLTYCSECGVHLCIGSCNETFHTCAKF